MFHRHRLRWDDNIKTGTVVPVQGITARCEAAQVKSRTALIELCGRILFDTITMLTLTVTILSDVIPIRVRRFLLRLDTVYRTTRYATRTP